MTSEGGEVMGNRHIGPHHAYGPGIHIQYGGDPFWLIDGNQKWFTEWHIFFGPTRLNAKTHNPCENQPGERSRFWLVVQWWHDQGGVVVDGVGVWKEPPIVEARYTKIAKGKWVPDPNGEKLVKHYEGYENWNFILS